jgi:hypothetical protein
MPSSGLGTAEVSALLSLIASSAQAALAEYTAHGEDVPSIYSYTTHPLDGAEDTLALRKSIRVLEGACNQLCSMLAPPAHTLHNVRIT